MVDTRTKAGGGTKERWLTWCLLLTLISATAPATNAQPQAARPARLSGRVLGGDTGKPLRGAFVNVIDTRASNPTERKGRWIATGADGRWEIADLTQGRYSVTVT